MMDIDVVDATSHDLATRLDRSSFPHALRVTTLHDLVLQVTARFGFHRELRRLRIIAHGHAGAQGLGNSHSPLANVFDSSTSISMDWMAMQNLADVFAPEGWLELHGCHVAHGYAGKAYLARLAGLLGVPVRAGTGLQFGGSRANDEFLWGEWREARPLPDGSISYRNWHGQ